MNSYKCGGGSGSMSTPSSTPFSSTLHPAYLHLSTYTVHPPLHINRLNVLNEQLLLIKFDLHICGMFQKGFVNLMFKRLYILCYMFTDLQTNLLKCCLKM